MRIATLCVYALLQALPEDSGPLARVLEGSARLSTGLPGERGRTLEGGAEAVRLAGTGECLTLRALGSMELSWRGRASATFGGPADLTLEASQRVRISAFREAEIEVRRSTLEIALVGYGILTLDEGVLCLRRLSGTRIELLNRGARALPVRLGAGREVWIQPGERLRLRRSAGPAGS